VIAIFQAGRNSGEIWHLKTAYKSNWGQNAGTAAPDRGREGERRRFDGKSVSVQSRVERPRCLPAACGFAKAAWKKCWRDCAIPPNANASGRTWTMPTRPHGKTSGRLSGGGDGVMLSSVLNPELRKYEGMTLTQIGSAMGKDPRDAVMDLVIADRGESSVIIAIMNEEDVRTALQHPLVGVGTDSGAKARTANSQESKSHPRGWAHSANSRQIRARRASAHP